MQGTFAGARPQSAGSRPQSACSRPQSAGSRPQTAGSRPQSARSQCVALSCSYTFASSTLPKKAGRICDEGRMPQTKTAFMSSAHQRGNFQGAADAERTNAVGPVGQNVISFLQREKERLAMELRNAEEALAQRGSDQAFSQMSQLVDTRTELLFEYGKQLHAVQQENQALKLQLEELKVEKAFKVGTDPAILRSELDAAEKDKADFEVMSAAEMASLRHENDEAIRKVQTKDQVIQQRDNKIQDLDSKLFSLQEEIGVLQREMGTKDDELQVAASDAAVSAAEMASLRNAHDEAITQIRTKDQVIQQKENKIQDLDSKLNVLQAEIGVLQKEMGTKDGELQVATKSLEGLRQECDEAVAQVQTNNAEAVELQVTKKSLVELRNAYDEAVTQIQKKDDELKKDAVKALEGLRLRNAYDEAVAQLQKKDDELQDAVKSMERLRNAYDEAIVQVQTKDQMIQQKDDKIQDMGSKFHILNGEMTIKDADLQVATKSLEFLETAKAALSQELESLKQELEACKSAHASKETGEVESKDSADSEDQLLEWQDFAGGMPPVDYMEEVAGTQTELQDFEGGMPPVDYVEEVAGMQTELNPETEDDLLD